MIIYISIFSFLISILIIFLIIKSRFSFLEVNPTKRGLHTLKTHTAGGLVFLFPSLFIPILSNYLFPLYCLPVALIGIIDDILDMGYFIRLLFQSITALLLVINSDFFNSIYLKYNFSMSFFSACLLVFIIVAIINFINFMDGMDLMVGGSFFLIFLLLSLFFNSIFIPLVVSLGVFCYFNKPPALIFMGDVGSTYLAALFIGFCLTQTNINNFIGLSLIPAPLYFDACITVIRNLNRGYGVGPHKRNLYQRLHKFGLSKKIVPFLYIIFVVINFLAFYYFGFVSLIWVIILELIFGLYLNKYKASPFSRY